jgi:hypothetical protein
MKEVFNENQKFAIKQIKYASEYAIDTKYNEYQDRYITEEELPTVDQLSEQVYESIMNNYYYSENHISWGCSCDQVKFCTRDWLMSKIKDYVSEHIAW